MPYMVWLEENCLGFSRTIRLKIRTAEQMNLNLNYEWKEIQKKGNENSEQKMRLR